MSPAYQKDPAPDDDRPPRLAVRRATDRCFHVVEEAVAEGYIVQGVLIPHDEVVEVRPMDDPEQPPRCGR